MAKKSSKSAEPTSADAAAKKPAKAAKPAPAAAKPAPKKAAPAAEKPAEKPAAKTPAKAPAKPAAKAAEKAAGKPAEPVVAAPVAKAAPKPPAAPAASSPPTPKAKAAKPAKAPAVEAAAEAVASPPKPALTDDEDLAEGGDALVADLEAAVLDEPAAPPAPVAKKPATAKKAAAEPPPEAPPPPPPPPVPTDLPPRRADGTITVAHSPDADDAFMFYALAAGRVDTEGRRYEHVLKDIQTLNEEAKKGTYDVTAVSFHAYPYVRQNYALLTCGASFGDMYGPILVAKSPIRPNEVEGLTVALPGALTTAALVTRLWFGRAKIRAANIPFDKVTDAVRAGMVRAGVIIHEGQLTYREQGLVRVVDFGQWWGDQTEGLPLPLGGNGVRRDIPKELATKIALDLKRSIAYALGHREEALAYAMKFGRNLSKEKADKFVGMYVNDLTLDYGERGRQALRVLYERANAAGLLAERVEPEFI